MALTGKQQAFVEAYIGQAAGNATEACRLAGYKGSKSALGKQGHDNLNNPKIAAALYEATAHLRQHNLMLAEERLKLLARLASGEEPDTFVTKDGWESGPCKADTRIRAIQEMNKMQGSYLQQVEHTHRVVRMDDNVPTHEIEARVRVLKDGEG